MADEKPGQPDSLLILGGLGLAALVVLCAAMVLLAFLFLRAPHNAPTQTVTITNGSQPALAASPAPSPEPSPAARRKSANDQDGAVPFSLSMPGASHGIPRRSDAQDSPLPAPLAAPAAPLAPAVAKPTEAARLPERADLSAPMGQDAPLPNRLHLIHRSKPASVAVAPALAVAPAQAPTPAPVASAAPALAAPAPAPAAAAAPPMGAVQEGSPEAQGQQLSQAKDTPFKALPAAGQAGSSLRLSGARVLGSAKVGSFRALKGFLMVQADLELANAGQQPLDLRSLQVEAEDSDGLGYPANPDLLAGQALPASLKPGDKASWSVVFLVPDDASLARLHLDAGGQSAELELAAAP